MTPPRQSGHVPPLLKNSDLMSILMQKPNRNRVFRTRYLVLANSPPSSTSCSCMLAFYKHLKHSKRALSHHRGYRPFLHQELCQGLSPLPIPWPVSHSYFRSQTRGCSSINLLSQTRLPLPAPSIFPSRICHNMLLCSHVPDCLINVFLLYLSCDCHKGKANICFAHSVIS